MKPVIRIYHNPHGKVYLFEVVKGDLSTSHIEKYGYKIVWLCKQNCRTGKDVPNSSWQTYATTRRYYQSTQFNC